jgi:hexosaminidase
MTRRHSHVLCIAAVTLMMGAGCTSDGPTAVDAAPDAAPDAADAADSGSLDAAPDAADGQAADSSEAQPEGSTLADGGDDAVSDTGGSPDADDGEAAPADSDAAPACPAPVGSNAAFPADTGCTDPGGDIGPSIVPWPRCIQLCAGHMALSGSRIVAASAELLPLGRLLSDEISATAGLRLSVLESASAAAGDILLQMNPAYEKDEAYRLVVRNGALVEGRSYEAVSRGTVSLLQAIVAGSSVELPYLTIVDEPESAYRGLMIDVARKTHSVANLQGLVQIARLYKVRYLQLHLTDNEAFTFPSATFPKLAAASSRKYTREELDLLEAYSQERGVTIIPELDAPGHGAAMTAAMPELFSLATGPTSTINFAEPAVMVALDTLVGEMSDVFRASPYFHIGSDEVNLAGADADPAFVLMLAQQGLSGPSGLMQLYRKFIVDMDPIVKKRGKRTVVWEGFRHDPASPFQIPKDVLVMTFEMSYLTPEQTLADGYDNINASWFPLYLTPVSPVWSPADLYTWNLYQYGPPPVGNVYANVAKGFHVVGPSSQVLGAQMCSWEREESIEIPTIRADLPVVSERVWNPNAAGGFSDYDRRYQHTNELLGKLIP